MQGPRGISFLRSKGSRGFREGFDNISDLGFCEGLAEFRDILWASFPLALFLFPKIPTLKPKRTPPVTCRDPTCSGNFAEAPETRASYEVAVERPEGVLRSC